MRLGARTPPRPTTSMSLSKPSSFARWSRVSGMSSTMRTRIWSAIESLVAFVRSLVRSVDGRGIRTDRRARPAAGLGRACGSRRPAADWLLLGMIAWMICGGRTPYLSTRVLRMMPVVGSSGGTDRVRQAGRCGRRSPWASGGRRRQAAVDLGEADDLGLLGVTARITISCWPLRLVGRDRRRCRRRRGSAAAAVGAAAAAASRGP